MIDRAETGLSEEAPDVDLRRQSDQCMESVRMLLELTPR